MTQLKQIVTNAEELVEYRTGGTMEEIPDDELDDCVEPLEGATGDLDALHEAFDEILSSRNEDDNDEMMEREAVVALHRHLDITPRHASHPGLWHWLCVVEFPEYIRYRFDLESGALRTRFLGGGSRFYSNGLERLWWFAELTYDDEADDYSRTERMLEEGNHYIVERIFDRSFGKDPDAAKAAVDVLVDCDGTTAEKVAKRFRHRETNYHLEIMSREQIKDVLDGILTEVEATV